MAKKTALYERHLEAGAKMVEFAGWLMPLQYAGVLKEHAAVRQRAGIFDVSHMGEVLIEGIGAERFVNRLVTTDVSKMKPGQVLYAVICKEDGGLLDDLLVYRFEESRFMLVVNASNAEKDYNWIASHADSSVEVRDAGGEFALLALQGPNALDILGKLVEVPQPFDYYSFYRTQYGGAELIVSRTGYTGEDGVEIYLKPEKAVSLWDALMDAGGGLMPTGLAARDLLRIEAGYPLYGHELDEETDPITAGLKWAVKMDKRDFIGKSALIELKPKRKKIGLVMEGRSVPRQDYPIIVDGEKAGGITSGTFSPVLQKPIGIGYISLHKKMEKGRLRPGQKLAVEIRGKEEPAQICRMPFIEPHTARKNDRL